MTQILLFRDPSPLVDRLGRDFFRQLPERPGIYLMRGASDELLYVGKAKNLRQRLGHYRVANPDRMPRRHLRLLRAVQRIEVQECEDERSALERESQLLRTLKPKFNRAGTWPGTPRFLAWKTEGNTIELTVTATPGADWKAHGPMGAGARHVRAALVRLLWFASAPERGIAQMPAGWFRGRCGDVAALRFPFEGAGASMENLFAGHTDQFAAWVLGKGAPDMPAFEKTVLEADIEFLTDYFAVE
jgi:predicted GIY-YIG superfamily endonuclease